MSGLTGVYVIVSTPFQENGDVDEESLDRHLRATLAAGVDGITVLGVAGEAARLTDAERDLVAGMAFARAAGKAHVVVGISHDGTRAAIERAQDAKARGAVAVMVAPPTFSRQNASLVQHFRAIGEEAEISIVLQDFPAVNGVTMEPQFMAEVCRAVPQVETIKLEEPPTATRIRRTLQLLDDDRTIVGGMSGLYMWNELRSGASGIMTGFPYPEVLVDIWRRFQSGDLEGAADVYYRYLPLNLADNQPGVGVATRKEVLKRRGQLTCAAVRAPGGQLDPAGTKQLHDLVDRLDLDRFGSGLPDA